MTDYSAPPAVERIEAAAYSIPTEQPESDGTLQWDSTTLVVVTAHAAGVTGIGYTYAGPSAVAVIREKLASAVQDQDATTPAATWAAMQHSVRNLGRPGVVAEAISAVDIALWDLHARLANLPLAVAVGQVHQGTPIYGSGGFTSYDDRTLADQLSGWAQAGIPRVKIKVGRDPDRDEHRLEVARRAIGDDVQLFVDANGAYSRKQALWWAERFADFGVRWYEEPVSSDDLHGLRLLRDRAPGCMDIAAGEYGYTMSYFHHMLDAGAVDCLQIDVTRCTGISAFLRLTGLCDARTMDVSLHCAPQVSAQVGTAAWHLRHLEYFHDHVRIEGMAFDGVLPPDPMGSSDPTGRDPGWASGSRRQICRSIASPDSLGQPISWSQDDPPTLAILKTERQAVAADTPPLFRPPASIGRRPSPPPSSIPQLHRLDRQAATRRTRPGTGPGLFQRLRRQAA